MAKASDMLLLYRFGAVRTLADAAKVFAEDATRASRSRRRQQSVVQVPRGMETSDAPGGQGAPSENTACI